MLASGAISALMTTTAIAGTDDGRACLLGLTVAGQSVNIGCIGRKRGQGAQPSVRAYCGPRGERKVFYPLTWSTRDTQETKDEIRAHNAAGRSRGCWK